VYLLRYRFTGWNHGHGDYPSPVSDARWALEQLRQKHGTLPVVLLGHSMGARTSATVADDPAVHGVVALAPWFPPGQPVEPLAGKHLVAAHGQADRITNFGATTQFVRRAGAVAASSELVDMGDLDHYMLKGIGSWNQVARTRTIALHGNPPLLS
jgi:alpha-beta hydrolase superfamily lysophospholipase